MTIIFFTFLAQSFEGKHISIYGSCRRTAFAEPKLRVWSQLLLFFFSLFVFPFNDHCVFKNTHFLHTQEYLHTKVQTNLFRVGLLTARDLLT